MNKNFKRQRLITDINMTPLTDIALVLLIIFMITTPLISQSNIKVNLPQAKGSESSGSGRHDAWVEITITREGVVYLDGKVVTRKELKEQMRIMHSQNPGLSVTVRSDRFVRFQEIVNVLDPLNELGITKLNIAAVNEQ